MTTIVSSISILNERKKGILLMYSSFAHSDSKIKFDTKGYCQHKPLLSAGVVAGSSEAEIYAAAQLKYYLEKKGVDCAGGAFKISVSIDRSIVDDGYRICTDKNCSEGLSIVGGNGRGVLYGVYRFLEEYAGIRFFTPTLEVIPDGDIRFDEINIEYTPVFEKRSIDWYPARTSIDWMVKNGVNDCAWMGVFPNSYGGSWNYGPFSVHTLGALTETGNAGSPNPCLTDPENLRKAIANVREVLRNDPTITSVSVSQNDNNERCNCAACAAIDAEDESPSGALLRFANAVAADIAKDYPHVIVDTLAYNYSQMPPKITRPLPNVAIRLCSFRCHFTHPLNDGKCNSNAAFAADLSAWSKICSRIYIWDYTTNYRYAIPTFANFEVLRENMSFFADNNVEGMFPSGNFYSLSGEFGELRAYLLAKLMQHPYMSADEYDRYTCEFLQAYYGEGWQYIYDYIKATSTEALSGCQSIYGHPFAAVSEQYYRKMEEQFEEWWSKTEALAGERLDCVKRSRLQWRYIRLMLHPNLDDARRFIADVEAAGVAWTEGNLPVPNDADLSKAPNEWFTYTWWLD